MYNLKIIPALFISLFCSITIHELGHAVIFNIFGVGVGEVAVGLLSIISIPLYNDFIARITIGLLPLGGYTVPIITGYLEIYHPFQYLLVTLAGVTVNFFVVLLACWLYKNGRRFSRLVIFFININLMLAILNLAPVPGFDGWRAMVQIFVLFGFFSGSAEFHNWLGDTFLNIWLLVSFMSIFLFIQIPMGYIKKFLKYENGLLPARKK